MHIPRETLPALAGVDLTPGLPLTECERRLIVGLHLHDTGQRILAFYLADMADRRLHQAAGFGSTAHFAEVRLGLDRRRTSELVAVGRRLLELPAIDAAFAAGRLCWSKVLLLVRVASPEHEEAWLEKALALSCRDLDLEVRLSRPGRPPRSPGDHKGLPEVRFPLRTTLPALTHQKIALAQEKLSAERGEAVGIVECLDVLAGIFLDLEEDGSVPGRTRVDASLYRIVLRPLGDADERGEGSLGVETEAGLVPIADSDAIRCDAPHDSHAEEGATGETPPALRRRVLARDGHRCRSCGSRRRLHVHHVRYRSQGGRTCPANLVTLCDACHALVHDGLLVLEGPDADRLVFHDERGRLLADPGEAVVPEVLRKLRSAPLADTGAAMRAGPRTTTLDTVPDAVDGSWWRRHAALVKPRRQGGLELVAGVPEPMPENDAEPAPSRAAVPFERALDGLVGMEAVRARLEAAAEGSRARARPFPHTLLSGPPGTGKTTLAEGLASALGARLVRTSGPLLSDAHSLVGLLTELTEGDVLFVDEVHAVPRAVLEALYEAVTTRRISLTLHAAARSRAVALLLPTFTLVAATTEEGALPTAFRGRFGLREHLGGYREEDLAALVTDRACSEGFALAEGAARLLAATSRGIPREALRLLDRVLDRVARRGLGPVERAAVARTLADLGYDGEGLDPAEQRYLALLRRSPRPLPLARLARLLGTSATTVSDCLEPWLFARGLVVTTSRGRLATA